MGKKILITRTPAKNGDSGKKNRPTLTVKTIKTTPRDLKNCFRAVEISAEEIIATAKELNSFVSEK